MSDPHTVAIRIATRASWPAGSGTSSSTILITPSAVFTHVRLTTPVRAAVDIPLLVDVAGPELDLFQLVLSAEVLDSGLVVSGEEQRLMIPGDLLDLPERRSPMIDVPVDLRFG